CHHEKKYGENPSAARESDAMLVLNQARSRHPIGKVGSIKAQKSQAASGQTGDRRQIISRRSNERLSPIHVVTRPPPPAKAEEKLSGRRLNETQKNHSGTEMKEITDPQPKPGNSREAPVSRGTNKVNPGRKVS